MADELNRAAPIAAQLDQQEQPKSDFRCHLAASGKAVEGWPAWKTGLWNSDRAAQLDQDAERAAFEDAYFAEWLKRNAEYDQCREWIFTRVTGDTETYLVIETREAWAGWQIARRAAPAAAQPDAELPTLPEPFMMLHVPAVVDAWKDQMHGYARQAVAPYAERIRLLEREMAEMRGANDQAWGICNAVADALGDDLDREAGSAESIRNLRRAYIDGRTAGTAPEAARECTQPMLEAAMKAAVSAKMFPPSGSEDAYLRYWYGMKASINAALAAAPSPQENTK